MGNLRLFRAGYVGLFRATQGCVELVLLCRAM